MRKSIYASNGVAKDQLLLAFKLSFTTAFDSCRVPPPQAITMSFFGKYLREHKRVFFYSEDQEVLEQDNVQNDDVSQLDWDAAMSPSEGDNVLLTTPAVTATPTSNL
ncbi:hypothetical protein F511_40510 [Dorcoceras hygrometricum]|uniref:Uncharacterized protein n=1 Tax=Dorcoceras hygrometricum TaxID=472368 RepID=A0A2Z7A8L3_9LAMI|nr:hypothetical protein F511_40510 [Dorcoceras hygrometricum]